MVKVSSYCCSKPFPTLTRLTLLSVSRPAGVCGAPMIPADDDAGVLSLSPSFNSYSSGKLAEIAARVVREFRQERGSGEDNYVWEPGTFVSPFQDFSLVSRSKNREQEKVDGDDDEFEFATVCREPYASIISADEIFYNGQIRPTYPLFGTDLLLKDSNGDDKLTKLRTAKTFHRSSLRMLMSKDREVTLRSSSLTDELEGVSPETYCAWSAKDSESSREAREKSKSSGSSKRWRFMNFLNRSSSDGKEMFMLLNAINKKTNKIGEAFERKHGRKVSRVGDNAASGGELSEKAKQTEEQHRNNREMEEMDAKKPNFLHRETLLG